MKIGLISGHGAGDSGAVSSIYKESDLTIEVVKSLKEHFEDNGIITKVYPYERNAYKDAVNGNLSVDFSDCDYVLEIHFNSAANDINGNGKVTGSEIWVTPRETTTKTEKYILTNLEALGFTNRGVKSNDFLVINRIKDLNVSGALIEVAFIDDADDMKLYNSKKAAITEGIVKGVCTGFGIEYKATIPINTSFSDAENYIKTDYIEFLHRLPASSEISQYTQALVNGTMTETDIDNAIKGSQEYNTPYSNDNYKRFFIIKCYYLCLGRFPENEAAINNHMQSGRLRDIFYNIYNSPEAQNYRK